MTVRPLDWPAPAADIARARERILDWAHRAARVIVAPHGDADGLSAGALTVHALQRLGATPMPLLPGKGEHVHTPAMQARLREARADGLVVLDMGSRPGPVVPGLPTIILDHHDAPARPDGDIVFVSAAGHEPVAPTGLLAHHVLADLVYLDDLAWLALLATIGDLGPRHPFTDELRPIAARHRISHLQEAAALINAARRTPHYRPERALAVLLAAPGPREIARREVPGTDDLVACRSEVRAELDRVARTPPRIANNVALLRFSSPAQIHPLIATRWAARLAPKIVIAANDGYLPGRVNFAVRSASSVDLLAFLRGLGLGSVEGEFANGHPRATGGSIPPHELARMLEALGFDAGGMPVAPPSTMSEPSAPATRAPTEAEPEAETEAEIERESKLAAEPALDIAIESTRGDAINGESMARRFADALRRSEELRDPDDIVALFHPDAELRSLLHDQPMRGLAGARRFWQEYLATFRTLRSRFERASDSDGLAVLEWVTEGTLRSGEPVIYRGVTLLEHDGARVRSFRTYYDSAALSGRLRRETPDAIAR